MRFAKNHAHWAFARVANEPGSTRQVVFIIDSDGPKSITNDAEAVVHDLNQVYPRCRIFYRDTMGNWDELCHDYGIFTGFKSGTDGWATP